MARASQLLAQGVSHSDKVKMTICAFAQEVAAVEAETQEVFAENQSLNRQQGGLNAEVGARLSQAILLAAMAQQEISKGTQ